MNIKYLFAILLYFSAILSGQELYPDSAVIIGYSHYESATGTSCGNRISVRDSYGTIHAVFSYARALPYYDSSGIYYVFSSDNGHSWSNPENISQCDSCSSEEPDLAIDSRNRLHCVWKQFYNDTTTVYDDYDLFYSRKDSAGWTRPVNISRQSLGANACYSSMAIDSRDYVHVVWDMSMGPGNWDIFYSFYNDTVWSPPYQLSNSPYDDAFPSLAVDKNDHLHVTWRQRTSSGPIFHTFFDGISWTPPEVIASIPGSQSGGSCIVVDSLNYPHVVFNNAIMPNDSSEIYYIYHDGATWTTPLNLSNTVHPSYQPSLAIDSLDNLYLVWEEKVPNYRTDILYRIKNGDFWSAPVNLTQDTTGAHAPHLGSPVTQDRVDLIWSSFLSVNPDRYEIVYLGLNYLCVNENHRPTVNSIAITANPNPFRNRIDLCLKTDLRGHPANEAIRIFDAAGRLIKTYKYNISASPSVILWTGDDEHGNPVPVGVYFIKGEGDKGTKTIKIVKIK